ncbi:MAG TPA: glycosyltransferase family A protein [Nevskiaceae bacterium]|nr:glycosyltransferase family A protein [Nevskiaceae bacterium]
MKRKNGPRITAAICTYDRYPLLAEAIDSLVEQSLRLDQFRILVVDNSPDAERARAAARALKGIPNLDYVIEKNPGLANARNVAVRRCGTDLIAFMDDDAVADRKWLAEIVTAFDAFGAAVVGGRVDPTWAAPRPSWLDDGLLGHLSLIDWGGRTRIAKPEEWFAGTNVAFRAQAIRDRGGFSTNLGRVGSNSALLGNEEVQLIERIRRAGGQRVYAPKAFVHHRVEAERLTRTWFRKRAAWQAVSDFTMDSARFMPMGSKLWNDTLHYLNALPPHERGMRGLLVDTDDPALFRWQTSAIYMTTMLALMGFEGAGDEALR